MNKRRAEAIVKMIESHLIGFCDNVDKEDKKFSDENGFKHHPIERLFSVSAQEKNGEYYVSLSTDGTIYELFYSFGDDSHKNLAAIEKKISQRFKQELYFEHEGMGDLTMWD